MGCMRNSHSPFSFFCWIQFRQGFDKNLYPHPFCWHTLRVHDIVWRMGFTRALLSTSILQTIS